MPVQCTCQSCGRAFAARPYSVKMGWGKFCSNACKGRANVSNIAHWSPSSFEATCEACGKTFRTTPKQTRGRFCSRPCWGRWMSENIVGEVHPNTGRNFDRPKTTVDVTCRVCGTVFQDSPVHSVRRFTCSKACGGAWLGQTNVGKNNHTWRGGGIKYYGPSWRPAARKARARDRVCQDCGISPAENGRALDVHHLVSFRSFGVERHEEANRLENLVSLCLTCHLAREWATNRRSPVHQA